jgi:hypothetical protein
MVVVAALAGCGGSGGQVVASVDGRPITKSAVDHWLSIEAVLTYQLRPTKRIPKGVVPDPPSYSACISYLRSVPQFGLGAKTVTTAALKSKCQQRYQSLREAAISFLISTRWVMGEAKELGLSATDAEARARLHRVERTEFPKEAEFKRHLQLTGEDVSDQILRAKVKVLTEKFEQRFTRRNGATPQQQLEASARFAKELPRKWVTRTSCRGGYVVPDCRQYRGSQTPEVRV